MSASILYWLIVGCEAAFWLLLVSGLTSRYILRRKVFSNVLLLALPIVDLVLLTVTALDLKSGASATFAHGLAAAYVGFTIAFGGITVAWADRHFAHRFAGAPAPPSAPEYGWPALRYELQLWVRCVLAAAITLALLASLIAFVDKEPETRVLREWFGVPIGAVIFWFIFGPLWTLLFSSWRRGKDG